MLPVTANRFVNKRQTGRHEGRRAVQHRYRYGIQTSRIRPIAFDIYKDVGVSGVVQPCLPSHTLLWCVREDHGCDRSEVLMSYQLSVLPVRTNIR